MKLKDVFRAVIFLLSVPKCVCCGEKLNFEDRALCSECMKKYLNHKDRNCSRCSKKLPFCDCTSMYLGRHSIKHISKVFRYTKHTQNTPWNCLVYSLKKDNRADVIDFLSDELAESIKNTTAKIYEKQDEFIVTNIPRRKSAIQEYGYDHAKILAENVAKKLGIRYLSLLKSKTKKAQKTTFGEGRIKNVKFDYTSAFVKNLTGKKVIIIDDIITTGASIASAAKLIRTLGFKQISAASVAIAYYDIYKPFIAPYEAKKYKSKYYFNRKKRAYVKTL